MKHGNIIRASSRRSPLALAGGPIATDVTKTATAGNQLKQVAYDKTKTQSIKRSPLALAGGPIATDVTKPRLWATS